MAFKKDYYWIVETVYVIVYCCNMLFNFLSSIWLLWGLLASCCIIMIVQSLKRGAFPLIFANCIAKVHILQLG